MTSVTINGLRTDLLLGARYRLRYGKESRMIWSGELTERAANGDLIFLEHGDPSNFAERVRVRPSTIDAIFGDGTGALDYDGAWIGGVEPREALPEREIDEPAASYLERVERSLGAAYTRWVGTEAGQAVLEEVRRAEAEARVVPSRKMTKREAAVSGRDATVIPFGPVSARVKRGQPRPEATPESPATPDGRKICKRCKAEKGTADFGKVSRNPDGLNTWCRACDAEAKALRNVTKAAAS